jgi:DNA-directed RNA polymerase I, II, and III subunit RPABC3
MTELFQASFRVADIDKDGKQFDNIARLECRSDDDAGAELVLDVNCQLVQFSVSDTFLLCLVDSESLTWEPSLFENWKSAGWHYVMHGKVFRYEPKRNQTATVYVSFGGLLMQLTGPHEAFEGISVGRNLYLQLKP